MSGKTPTTKGRVGRRDSLDEQEWRRYVAGFHERHPAITERVLGRLRPSPYAWMVEPLPAVPGPVLDLACGSAPTRAVLPDARWVGVDSAAAELACARFLGRGPLVRADASALPFGDSAVAAVCAAMCLPVLTPLPRVLDEVHRVLRPGGTLTALVPARLGWSALAASGWVGWLRVVRSVGVLRQSWPNPGACDGAGRVLRAHGFAITSDERRLFPLPLDTPDDTALLLDSLYLPGVSAARLDTAKRTLAAWARPGRRLPMPLRRVVAHVPPVADLVSRPWSTEAEEERRAA